MASYLPNITDYLPQIQPFRPDYNFYAGALQMKQTQYDSAHKQLSGLYGSLLNAPMLRDGNIKARDDYFKAVDQEIKKISGLDLSKNENVTAASQIFQGLYDNDNIIKDMVWTRNYQKELQRADGFRACVDPEKCGGAYWEGGVKALHYKADEFRKASDQQALQFGNVRYTPYQNVMERAIKAAKDAGLSISVDQLQGRYITTTKNGPVLVDPLNSLFTGLFASDPAIMDYYKTKAYVDRKDWIQQNIPVYGSEAGAQAAYLNNLSDGINTLFGKSKQDVDVRSNNITGQKRQIEERIKREGTSPNSTLAEQYRNLNSLEQSIQSSKESIDTAYSSLGKAQDPSMRGLSADYFDNAVAQMYLMGDINQAAQTLAYKDYEFKMKADPYALESVRHSNRMQLESFRHSNRMTLQKFKFDQKAYGEKLQAQGDQTDNVPLLKRIVEGGADVNLEAGAAHQMYKDKEGNIQMDISGNEKNILVEMLNLTQLKSKGEKGTGLATDDLVKFGDIVFNELTDVDNEYYVNGRYVSNERKAGVNRSLKKRWDNMSYDQKVKFAQGQDFENLLNNSNLSGTVLDNIYNEYALPLLDMNQDANRVNRNYLGDLWANSAPQRKSIELKNSVLQGMGEWYTNESQKIIQDMKTSSEFSDVVPLMEMYIDPDTGRPRSKEEFVSMFANEAAASGDNYEEAAVFASALYEGKSYGPMDFDHSLQEVWAQAFGTFMDPEGGSKALGLIGSDSKAVMGLNFPAVDPSKYASGATMNTLTFLRDVIAGDDSIVRGIFGSTSSELPTANDQNAMTLINQLYTDMLSQKSPKDQNRPILNVTYQDIAGGNADWTALNIKFNSPYVQSLTGSKQSPGVAYGQVQTLMQDGVTLYLKKSAAQNGFRQGVQRSPVEDLLYYNSEYTFDAYPEHSQDFKLKQQQNGNYVVSGTIMNFDPESGEFVPQPFYKPFPMNTSPDSIVDQTNTWLGEIARINSSKIMQFNSQNSIKDPAALLNS